MKPKRPARYYLFPILALLGVAIGIYAVYFTQKELPSPGIPFPPPISPYAHSVAGEGSVEAASENISIGTAISEVVEEIYVTSGTEVKSGEPLFKLDTRSLESQLAQVQAAYEVAAANYQKQLDLPRPEDIPPQEAAVNIARANFQDRLSQFELYENVTNPKAISRDAYNQRKYAAESAKFALDQAQANLALLKAGAWIRDLEIYRAQKREAQKQIEIIQTNIARSTIRSPIPGTILRINIRKGEFVPAISAQQLSEPLLVMGPTHPLHIRVNIDEEDCWRVIKGAPGIAFVRGNSNMHVPLEYVRTEPLLIPKRTLTGNNVERVDTRVLQVIYKFDSKELPIYVGQLMDVFLEGRPYNEQW